MTPLWWCAAALPHPLPLHDSLYNGKIKKLAINRKVLCTNCKGTASTKPNAGKATCDPCNGQGVQVQLRRLGPGFVQQVQVECKQCSGTGSFVERKHRCQSCGMDGLNKKKETIEVNIDKGMMDGQRLTFHNMADDELGKTTGDVVIVIDEKPAPGYEVLKRQGMDLITQMEITLGEALTGFKKVFKHLDGTATNFSTSTFFWSISRVVLSFIPPHAPVRCTLVSAHAYRMMIGAWHADWCLQSDVIPGLPLQAARS